MGRPGKAAYRTALDAGLPVAEQQHIARRMASLQPVANNSKAPTTR